MFSTIPKPNFNFSAKFNLSSANVFSLDRSKNLSFGKELNMQAMLWHKRLNTLPNNIKFKFIYKDELFAKESPALAPMGAKPMENIL